MIFLVIVVMSFYSILNIAHAEIVLDDFSLDDCALRTMLVGSLSMTYSASRNEVGISGYNTVAWTPDGNYLVGGNNDGTWVFENSTLKIMATLTGYITGGSVYQYLDVVTSSTSQSTYYILTGKSPSSCVMLRYNGVSLQYLPQTVIASTDTSDMYASLSPNGQFIAVTWNNTLQIYRFNGASVSLITSLATGAGSKNRVDWSYDGSYVGILDLAATLRMYSFDGASLTSFLTLTNSGKTYFASPVFQFSPDDEHFVIGYTRASDDANFVNIYSYDNQANYVAANGSSFMSSPDADRYGVVWSPDGQYVVFSHNNTQYANGVDSGFYSLPTFGGGSTFYSWHPQGERLAVAVGGYPSTVNGNSSTLFLMNTGLVSLPSYTDAVAKAPDNLTTIVTSTADQFWGTTTAGDLLFSSTEASIARMRGSWVRAASQGSMSTGVQKTVRVNSVDNNFYAVDSLGNLHIATSVVVGPQVRINWQAAPYTAGNSPSVVNIFQGSEGVIGIDEEKNLYKYRTSVGWKLIGTSPL